MSRSAHHEEKHTMAATRHLRWWFAEGVPERLRRWRFRINPWARARQYRIERDFYQRWLSECEARQEPSSR